MVSSVLTAGVRNATYLDEGQFNAALGDAKAAGAGGLSSDERKGERYG
jgi:hypothetical protein